MAELDKRKTMKAKTYAAQGGGAALIGTIVAANYARVVPDVSAAEIAAVAAGVPLVINFIIKVALDAIHKRSILPPLVGLVLLVGLVGCKSTSTITYIPAVKTQPTITVEQGASGRNCIALTIDPRTGVIESIIDQAGESDWGGFEVIAKVIPDGIRAAVPFLTGNPSSLAGVSSGDMQGPAGFAGCSSLFGSAYEPDDDPNEPEVRHVVDQPEP